MKELFITTWVMLLCISPVFAQSRTGWEEDDLKGRVRALRVEQVLWREVRSKWKEQGRELFSESSYDTQGHHVESSIYTNGYPMKRVYSYDAKGHLAEVNYYEFGTRPFGKEEYLYNDKGQLVGKRVSNGIRVKYEYDPRGNKISETVEDSAKDEGPRLVALTDKTVYKYDDMGNLIEAAYFKSDGTKGTHSIFKAHRVVYEYDSKGLRTSAFQYDSDGRLIQKWVRKSESNKVSTEYTDSSGVVKSKSVSVYDYDSQGNWIKRSDSVIEFKDGKTSEKPTITEHRIISYY
jgi:YD repeat-containing protein